MTRHFARKSLSSGGHWSGLLSVGGGRLGIKKMARMGFISAYGGLPSAISMTVMPSDQMSTFSLYPISWITSGAIHSGCSATTAHPQASRLEKKMRQGAVRCTKRKKNKRCR